MQTGQQLRTHSNSPRVYYIGANNAKASPTKFPVYYTQAYTHRHIWLGTMKQLDRTSRSGPVGLCGVDVVLLWMGCVPLESPKDFRGYWRSGGDVRSLRHVAVLVSLELDAHDLAVGCRVRGCTLRDNRCSLGTRRLRGSRFLVAYAVARLETVYGNVKRNFRYRLCVLR